MAHPSRPELVDIVRNQRLQERAAIGAADREHAAIIEQTKTGVRHDGVEVGAERFSGKRPSGKV